MRGTSLLDLPDCRPLLADPDDLTLVVEPIVDLTAARVAGYAALSRFPGTAGPDVWFAAAADAGLSAELEALAIAKALARIPDLPPDTFLAVTVSPHLLGSAPVQAALSTRPDLRRVVVGLAGTSPAGDLTALRRHTDELRARGARVALDGSGSAVLQQMAELQPQFVTLDHALVAGGDPLRTALAGMLGELAERTGARLLAEGIETAGELEAVAGLGVPLARGWLLGRPAPDFASLTPEAARLVHARTSRARLAESVAGLIRPVQQYGVDEPAPGLPPAVLVGTRGEPLALLLADPRTAEVYTAPVSLQVPPSAGLTETLQHALARRARHRFEPVLCTGPGGAVLGLLRVEDLASAAHAR